MCAPRKKLIIELDGSQHLEQQNYDEERTKYLEGRGYRVLRCWNHDATNNIEAALNLIWSTVNDKSNVLRATHNNAENWPFACSKVLERERA
jgi:very-short-patch-repair endonuclease